MIAILGITFLGAGLLSVTAWAWWAPILKANVTDISLQKGLVGGYVALATSLLLCAGVSLGLAHHEIQKISLAVAVVSSAILTVQAGLLGFVLTPLFLARSKRGTRFKRALLIAECCVGLPVVSLLAANLLLFLYGGDTIRGLLQP